MRAQSIAFLKRLRQGLTPQPLTLRYRAVQIWFCLALTFATILAVWVLAKAFAQPYLIPDDARPQVFWMQRFVDSDLFANDLIADYYQSVSPKGISSIYKAAAAIGISPLLFNKILPAILIILTSAITFLTCFELCALPAAAFAASFMLGLSVGFTNNITSGTAKSFVYVVTFLFLYAWLRRSCWLSWFALLGQGFFYPQAVLISLGLLLLGIVERRGGKWQFKTDRTLWTLTLGGLAIATAVLLQYAYVSSDFGPTITAAEALTMPEFFQGGRHKFFRQDLIKFLLYGRSGIRFDSIFTPVTNLLGLVLPGILRFPGAFPLVQPAQARIGILPRLLVTSIFWFIAAHALLFKLYLPSRYSGHYLWMMFILAASITLVILIDALLYWAIVALDRPVDSSGEFKSLLGCLSAALMSIIALSLSAVLLLYPLTISGFPSTPLLQGKQPELYQFFTLQPKNSLIASLTDEANNISCFTGRSVLVSSEIAIAYHVGYYRIIRQRAKNLIQAQYSLDPNILQKFIIHYGITHWLLQSNAFELSALDTPWLQQYQPETSRAKQVLETNQIPIVKKLGERCEIFASERYRVLDAQCILASIESSPI